MLLQAAYSQYTTEMTHHRVCRSAGNWLARGCALQLASLHHASAFTPRTGTAGLTAAIALELCSCLLPIPCRPTLQAYSGERAKPSCTCLRSNTQQCDKPVPTHHRVCRSARNWLARGRALQLASLHHASAFTPRTGTAGLTAAIALELCSCLLPIPCRPTLQAYSGERAKPSCTCLRSNTQQCDKPVPTHHRVCRSARNWLARGRALQLASLH